MSCPSSPGTSTSASVPTCPNGLFNFPGGSVLVTDADEEYFSKLLQQQVHSPFRALLYSAHTNTNISAFISGYGSGGLGFFDGSKPVLDIDLVLNSSQVASDDITRTGRRSVTRKKQGPGEIHERIVSIRLQQDLGALKSRKGDTGSVLWRSRFVTPIRDDISILTITYHHTSSLYLARHILSQHHFPPPSPLLPLLNRDSLRSARILELGAGTGLLAILLSPLCASYTASDRLENLKLVGRNLELNQARSAMATKVKSRKEHDAVKAREPNVELEEVDWEAISKDRHRSVALGNRAIASSTWTTGGPETKEERFDLILAVDCIYNEHLVQPLVDTIIHYCQPGGQTVVWVVVELRSPEVLTQFLDTWLKDPSGPLSIVRLDEDTMGDWDGRRGRWVGWVGWR